MQALLSEDIRDWETRASELTPESSNGWENNSQPPRAVGRMPSGTRCPNCQDSGQVDGPVGGGQCALCAVDAAVAAATTESFFRMATRGWEIEWVTEADKARCVKLLQLSTESIDEMFLKCKIRVFEIKEILGSTNLTKEEEEVKEMRREERRKKRRSIFSLIAFCPKHDASIGNCITFK